MSIFQYPLLTNNSERYNDKYFSTDLQNISTAY